MGKSPAPENMVTELANRGSTNRLAMSVHVRLHLDTEQLISPRSPACNAFSPQLNELESFHFSSNDLKYLTNTCQGFH